MQIIYTHLDGSTTTYTDDTVLTANVFLGNSITGITFANRIEVLQANAKVVVPNPSVHLYGQVGTGFDYYGDVPYHVTDRGLSAWASERLSPDDLRLFTEQSANWGPTASDSSVFMSWWSRYISDPHVTLQANV